MKKPKTYVAILLDQSGSMDGCQEQVVRNFNEEIQQMKSRAKEQDIFCSLITFTHDVWEYEDAWCVDPKELKEITVDDLNPDGGTAWADAIGYTIDKLLRTTDNDDENVSYLLKVISDGEENSSKHYIRKCQNFPECGHMAGFCADRLNLLTQRVQATGRWTITYLGHNESYLRMAAARTSVPVANTAVWSNINIADARKCLRASSSKLNSYFDARLEGLNEVNCFYGDATIPSKIADFTELPDLPDEITVDSSVTLASTDTISTGTKGFSNRSKVTW